MANKTLARVLGGGSDLIIRFGDLCVLLRSLGFFERMNGSHHIFWRPGVDEILNLQPRDVMAKPYQVKLVRNVIVRHGLGGAPE